jgi:tetratricopeptide (TPR) repeat protein
MRAGVMLLLLVLAIPTAGQEPTEAGKKALDELIRRCIAAGGLKQAQDPATGTTGLIPGDPAHLRTAVAADRAALTPAVCDALIAAFSEFGPPQQPAILALLQAVGQEANDDRALAFATLLAARWEEEGQLNVRAARRLYEEAQRRFAALGDRAMEARCTNDIGFLDRELGEPAQALEQFQRALALARELHGERHSNVASALDNIGCAYSDLGQYDHALEHHRRGLAVRRQLYGERHPAIAISLNNIGAIHGELGEYAQALKHYRQALDIVRAVHGEQHPLVASSHNNIGATLHSLGEHA